MIANNKNTAGPTQRSMIVSFLCLACVSTLSTAFVVFPKTTTTTTTTPTTTTLSVWNNQQQGVDTSRNVSPLFAATGSSDDNDNNNNSIIVVSPPGGIGQEAAVRAASSGASVRWFVVSSSSSSSANVPIAPYAIAQIDQANGSLSLAGATVNDLLTSESSAIAAISQWCASEPITGLICTYDGCAQLVPPSNNNNNKDDDESAITLDDYQAALRLATSKASAGVGSGSKVVVLGATEDLASSSSDEEEGSGLGDLVGNLFGGGSNRPDIPSSMEAAVGSSSCTILRHGPLFGVPESSPDFSPLVGGPKRDPILSKEYSMRSIRMDPYVVSGNIMTSSSGAATTETSRHTMGQAAAYWATNQLGGGDDSSKKAVTAEISITSQSGTDEWTIDQWQTELTRVQDQLAASAATAGGATLLYTQDNMIVENKERLANWLATKWAPAILRTYDIAAIRIGARPVYATQPSSTTDTIEIVWQQLVDFESIVVGKMSLQVLDNGVVATRQPGDASKGYGTTSKVPLPGEDVLVRSLAQATSQAMEKGLAKKIPIAKPAKVEEAVSVSSVVSSGTVATEAAAAAPSPPPPPSVPQTGPRQSGARRSTQRKRRGTKAAAASTDDDDDTTSSDNENAKGGDDSDAFQ